MGRPALLRGRNVYNEKEIFNPRYLQLGEWPWNVVESIWEDLYESCYFGQ